MHTAVGLRYRALPHACLGLIVIWLIALAPDDAFAQGAALKKRSANHTLVAGPSDTVIISKAPGRKGRISAALKKLFSKTHGRVTGVPNSEVWSVPRAQTSRVSRRLRALGMKVTKLREDWNQILKRHRGPLARPQQAAIDKLKTTPGTVGVHVVQSVDAALSAFVMTNKGYKHAGEPQTPTNVDGSSRIVLPLSATRSITLERVNYSNDAHSCIWRGIVVETGESALLMRWQDGRITGLVGYKGRIYTVESLGGKVHAMVERDPRQMPPDHAVAKPTADPRADLRPDAPAKTAAPQSPPTVNPLSDADRQALEAKKIVIDLMILYTKRVASRYVRNPRDLLAIGIEQANEAFRNSGLANVSLRLVHTQDD